MFFGTNLPHFNAEQRIWNKNVLIFAIKLLFTLHQICIHVMHANTVRIHDLMWMKSTEGVYTLLY